MRGGGGSGKHLATAEQPKDQRSCATTPLLRIVVIRDTSDDTRSSSSTSVDTDESYHSITEEKIDEHNSDIGELPPIPTLKELTSLAAIADSPDMDDEPILYCCFVDWYNYIKMKMESKPKHEFQIIHVM
ncbi:uncharacterized protein LOC143898137 isoform X2 [Temnothorax americanus]|uniref:uncharacterized protein LOC143898137 isoform X2 n=1 Tax=Temnothorax americanus TaxID=1964332 RepID=UPI0040676825